MCLAALGGDVLFASALMSALPAAWHSLARPFQVLHAVTVAIGVAIFAS